MTKVLLRFQENIYSTGDGKRTLNISWNKFVLYQPLFGLNEEIKAHGHVLAWSSDIWTTARPRHEPFRILESPEFYIFTEEKT